MRPKILSRAFPSAIATSLASAYDSICLEKEVKVFFISFSRAYEVHNLSESFPDKEKRCDVGGHLMIARPLCYEPPANSPAGVLNRTGYFTVSTSSFSPTSFWGGAEGSLSGSSARTHTCMTHGFPFHR